MADRRWSTQFQPVLPRAIPLLANLMRGNLLEELSSKACIDLSQYRSLLEEKKRNSDEYIARELVQILSRKPEPSYATFCNVLFEMNGGGDLYNLLWREFAGKRSSIRHEHTGEVRSQSSSLREDSSCNFFAENAVTAQILVSGVDFCYKGHQKALNDLFVKITGIECQFSMDSLRDTSAVVTFVDTKTSSCSQLVQLILQRQRFLYNYYPLRIQHYDSPQISTASPPQANEDTTTMPPKSTAGRGRGGKRNKASAAGNKNADVSRPGNVSSLLKETDSSPSADSSPYQQPHHASPAPTHSSSSMRPESHCENFADGTASRSKSNWPPQPGGPGPSQPGLNLICPFPEWPPGQPRPLAKWSLLSSCQPKVEPFSLYPTSAVDTNIDTHPPTFDDASAVAPTPVVEPEHFELMLRAPDDIDEDILDYIYSDKRRERRFQRKFTLGELQWAPDTKTLTFTCRQLSSSESDLTKEVKDEIAALCDDYDKKFLYVFDSSLWGRALDYASKQNTIRGNSCSINGNRDESRIWFIGESVSDLHSQCANVIGEWLREKEKREEVIEDSISCYSRSRLHLVKSCKQYHALKQKVTLNAMSDVPKIDIKGQTYEVNSAKQTIVSLLFDIDEKIVTVEDRLWTFFQGLGFQQLIAAIEERQLRAVPVSVEEDHPGIRIAAFRDDLSEARLVVKSQFTSQQIEPEDDEQRTYLQTAQAAIAFEGVCSKLLLMMEGFGSPSEEFWVTGRADNVKKACNEVLKTLKDSVIYTKLLPLPGRSHIEYLFTFSNIHIDFEGLLFSLPCQYKARIAFYKIPPSILLKATQDSFASLQRRVEALVDGLCTETEELSKHGLEKYLNSREFQDDKAEIQSQRRVIIALGEEDENDEEKVYACGDADDDLSSACLGVFNSTSNFSQVIRLFVGDLFNHRVDAIVNAAIKNLDHFGGLSSVIVEKAGDEVQTEIRRVLAKRGGRLKPGKALLTRSGLLTNTRFVIHAVGHRWHGSEKSKAAECLRYAVTSALKKANKFNLESVAFPAIGAGMFGYPSDFVAENIVAAVDKFFSQNPESQVKRVDIVMGDEDTKGIRSFSDALRRQLKIATSPIKPLRSPWSQRMHSGPRELCQKLKKAASHPNDSIRASVVGKSGRLCRAALRQLKSAAYDNCVRSSYYRAISTSAFDEGKLKEISNQFGVVLEIDVPVSNGVESSSVIYFSGKRAKVSEALIEMDRIFKETMVAAEVALYEVSWKWQSDDGSWKLYPKFANLEIEKVHQAVALKKAKSKFTITINMSKYEIDVQAMTQTSISKPKHRKIVRSGPVVVFPSTWSSKDGVWCCQDCSS